MFSAHLIKGIEDEAKQSRHASGKPPLGRQAILGQEPHGKPAEFERSPVPAFHASDPEDYRELRDRRIENQIAYRKAADRLKRGERDVEFPEDCFPPRLPFIERKPPT